MTSEMEWQEVKLVLYAGKKRHLKLGEAKHGNFIVYSVKLTFHF